MEKLYTSNNLKEQDGIQQLKKFNGLVESFTLKDVDFQGKDIISLKITNGVFHSCNFTEASIKCCDFNNCEFIKCNFSYTDILGTKFKQTLLDQNNFNNAILQDVVINDCSINNNNFQNVNIKDNVTVNGEDIMDNKQFKNILGDNINNNIIADDVNEESQVNVPEILKQFKTLKKVEQKSYELVQGNITLCIAEDESNWRVMIGYNKDGQFEDPIITQDLILQDDEEPVKSNQEIIDQIHKLVEICGEQAKKKVKTDMIIKNIDNILNKFKNDKPIIKEDIEESEAIFTNKMWLYSLSKEIANMKNDLQEIKELLRGRN